MRGYNIQIIETGKLIETDIIGTKTYIYALDTNHYYDSMHTYDRFIYFALVSMTNIYGRFEGLKSAYEIRFV